MTENEFYLRIWKTILHIIGTLLLAIAITQTTKDLGIQLLTWAGFMIFTFGSFVEFAANAEHK